MDIHKNARLTPHSRAELVRRVLDEGQTQTAVAAAFAISTRTVCKWIERFQAEGAAGLSDCSSRPHRLRRPTAPAAIERIEALRRQRWTGAQIAVEVGVSPATVSRGLRRLGLNKLKALEPVEPVRRYERERPGELIHIDIKKLGRFTQVGYRITGDRTDQSDHRGVGWPLAHLRPAFARACRPEASAVSLAKAVLFLTRTRACTGAAAATASAQRRRAHLFTGPSCRPTSGSRRSSSR